VLDKVVLPVLTEHHSIDGQGQGFSKSNIFQMRACFLGWEIFQTPSGILVQRQRRGDRDGSGNCHDGEQAWLLGGENFAVALQITRRPAMYYPPLLHRRPV